VLIGAANAGRFAVTNSAGSGIVSGAPADLLLLDYDALDDVSVRDDVDPVELIFARATARHMHELIVNGRTIVQNHRVLGIDLDAARREVLDRMRAGQPAVAPFAAALPHIGRALAEQMERHFSCS